MAYFGFELSLRRLVIAHRQLVYDTEALRKCMEDITRRMSYGDKKNMLGAMTTVVNTQKIAVESLQKLLDSINPNKDQGRA